LKKVSLIIAIVFLFAKADAQLRDPKLGIGADFGFPMASFGKDATYGVGGSLVYQQPMAPNLNITVNIGYLRFNGKQTIGTLKYRQSYIPLKGGARYFLGEYFYGGAEIGAILPTTSGNSTAFAYGPNLGLEFPVSDKGSLDFGIRYESWLRTSGNESFVGLRAGYNF